MIRVLWITAGVLACLRIGAQTHSAYEKAIQDSIALDSAMKAMEMEVKRMMDELARESEKKMAVFGDSAFVDSLRKANKDFSLAGTWRAKLEKEEVTFIFFKDGTWRARADKKPSEEIAGTWTITNDSLFLDGTPVKKSEYGSQKSEKIYVKYLPYSSQEVWLFVPFMNEKCVLKKVKS